jgi:hypothetical protein
MARDNAPKERQRKDLERKQKAQRAACDRILIVSEGSKTEPHYFEEIRTEKRLPTANVTAVPSALGTAPIQVVQHAKHLFERGDQARGIAPRAFEQVFAVFDRDDHASYFDALALAKSIDGTLKNDAKALIRFQAIASVPCFELWLLLHFEDIQSPTHRDEVMKRLKQHFPDYDKGQRGAYAFTRSNLDGAMKRAQLLANKNKPENGTVPYTAVVQLVRLLSTLGS